MSTIIDDIFNIKKEEAFNSLSLEVFLYQAKQNPVYKKYLNLLKIDISTVHSINEIPFLPIQFFKSMSVLTDNKIGKHNPTIFTSSGTTGSEMSKHIVSDYTIYIKSFTSAFELFYGNPNEYCILGLLPSYLERENSSLVYMVNSLIKSSKHPQSDFYLNNFEKLFSTISELLLENKKILLLGVTHALLDFAEYMPQKWMANKALIVMETGGMRGKRKEIIREELHEILCEKFSVSTIHSEYGMTELLSQAYSKGGGVFQAPPWMKVIIRDVNDSSVFLPIGKTGGVNVIDLANINSCSFIATQDLGKKIENNLFEVLGRFDNSELRGCNLMI